MKFIEITNIKQELDDLLKSINDYKIEVYFGTELEQGDIEFYRFIGKQIIFFKKILVAYPNSYFVKVLISDYYSLIINDVKKESRYYYLNQRSIIENYLRMIDKNEKNHSHVTRKTFEALKANNEISIGNYSKLMNEYKIACSYIHGGLIISDYLVANFQESLNFKTEISIRNRKSQRNQFIDMVNILNNLFLENNSEAVDSAFHRSKLLLKYLMNEKYINRLKKLSK